MDLLHSPRAAMTLALERRVEYNALVTRYPVGSCPTMGKLENIEMPFHPVLWKPLKRCVPPQQASEIVTHKKTHRFRALFGSNN